MNKTSLLEKLRREGFSERIVDAFARIERERFVPPSLMEEAYADSALPIGEGQTISQPSTIAFMLEKLELGEGQKVLEVGAGSGYVLALIKEIIKTGEIYGTERVKELAEKAEAALEECPEVKVFYTPQGAGLPDHAPFDRILASAAAENDIPSSLVEQLNKGGVLVCPVAHSIVKAKKDDSGRVFKEEYPGFVFVSLITGDDGKR